MFCFAAPEAMAVRFNYELSIISKAAMNPNVSVETEDSGYDHHQKITKIF